MSTLLDEIHSTHLTASCPKKVLLTSQGKAIGDMPGALYFGNLWHEACGLAHLRGEFQIPKSDPIVIEAARLVEEKAKAENRPLTDAVRRDAQTHQADVSKLLGFYGERCASLVKTGRVLGVEVPCRMTLTIDGEPQEFASHMDLPWINSAGELEIWDWKTTDEDPSPFYLNRNLQFGLYWLMGLYGEFLIDGFWDRLGVSPRLTWVQVMNLRPYGRKTTAKDDNGDDREYAKGEHRPLSRIMRSPIIMDEGPIIDEITTRVRMFRAGLFPTNPDPVGCRLCECWKSCADFQGEQP